MRLLVVRLVSLVTKLKAPLTQRQDVSLYWHNKFHLSFIYLCSTSNDQLVGKSEDYKGCCCSLLELHPCFTIISP